MDTQRTLPSTPSRADSAKDHKERGGEPLEIDRSGRQVDLDIHVVEATPDGACEPVPRLGLSVEAFRTPTMTLVQSLFPLGPVCASATGAEQRRIVVSDHHRLGDARLRQAVPLERTVRSPTWPFPKCVAPSYTRPVPSNASTARSSNAPTSSAFGRRSFHWKTHSFASLPSEDAIARLVGAILVDRNDEWVAQTARYMTLETIATVSDNALIELPAVAA